VHSAESTKRESRRAADPEPAAGDRLERARQSGLRLGVGHQALDPEPQQRECGGVLESLGEEQDARVRLACVDAGDDGLGDGELRVRLDDVYRRLRNGQPVEVGDAVGVEPALHQPKPVLTDDSLELREYQRMAPVETDRAPVIGGTH
jgi:hypothetical protein